VTDKLCREQARAPSGVGLVRAWRMELPRRRQYPSRAVSSRRVPFASVLALLVACGVGSARPPAGPDAAADAAGVDAAGAFDERGAEPSAPDGNPDVEDVGAPDLGADAGDAAPDRAPAEGDAIYPRFYAFPSVAVGGTRLASFTVTNYGNTTAPLAVAVEGSSFAFPPGGRQCPAMLDAGASCQVDVVFQPATAGDKTGVLVVTSGADKSIATLAGSALFSDGQLVGSGQFGSLAVNTRSAPEVFTLTNTGNAPTEPLETTRGGPNASEFLITTNGCVGPLGVGATCSLTVVFAPLTTGAKNAVLIVTASPGVAAQAALTGTAF
jgi:hypothetical protein